MSEPINKLFFAATTGFMDSTIRDTKNFPKVVGLENGPKISNVSNDDSYILDKRNERMAQNIDNTVKELPPEVNQMLVIVGRAHVEELRSILYHRGYKSLIESPNFEDEEASDRFLLCQMVMSWFRTLIIQKLVSDFFHKNQDYGIIKRNLLIFVGWRLATETADFIHYNALRPILAQIMNVQDVLLRYALENLFSVIMCELASKFGNYLLTL
jgi:hypothetical protein